MPPKQHNQAASTTAAVAGKKAPTTTMTSTKRVFLFASTLIPMLAFLSFQIPSFVTTDVVCSWTETFFSDAALDETKSKYAEVANAAIVGTQLYNRTMHWGTYRPNVLMGVKNRAPHPLLFGIAWYDAAGRFDVKHNAVESDRLMFRWEFHDGQFFGVQRIVDYENRIEFMIDFVKAPDGQGWDVQATARRIGGSNTPITFVVYFAHEGGAQKFPLQSLSGSTQHKAAANDDERYLRSGSGDVVGVAGAIEPPLAAATPTEAALPLIPFVATLTDSCQAFAANATTPWTEFAFSKPQDDAWNFDMRRTPGRVVADRSHHHKTNANNVMVFKKEFTSDFRIQVCLRELPSVGATEARSNSGALLETDVTTPQPTLLSSPVLPACQLTRLMNFHKASFEAKFEKLFLSHVVSARPASSSQCFSPDVTKRLEYLQKHSKALKQMASSALSSLIGSIGYWHGKYLVVPEEVDEASDKRGQFVTSSSAQRGGQIDSETTFSISLFSGAPSRAKFPRGFLWDEGFQQLLMYRWNSEVSKDVIAHWLMVAMDPATGWIPREQILGKESRGRVPREFAAQHPQHANPPSMVLAVQSLALSEHKTADDIAFLQRILPKLTAWRDWFHKTQCGSSPNCHSSRRIFPTSSDNAQQVNTSEFQYRWRSRNGFHLLACGLDDYPRPVCFADGRPSNSGGATVSTGNGVQQTTTHRKEKHVDLMSWMALMTETIESIKSAAIVSSNEEQSEKPKSPASIPWEELLVKLHWDAKSNRFSDVTGCPDVSSKEGTSENEGEKKKLPNFRGYSGHFSPYVGYVNLFPLLSLTINDKKLALSVLRLARDELNTPFGLASISLHSRSLLAQYGQQHESYWAGPIWININYLFLRALRLKYIELLGSEAEEFYHTLRSELLENILKQFIATDKLWENYHWESGKGLGTAPFTGWTALIVLILGEQY